MLISTRKRFIFFHLPKVAGTSINQSLRKYSDIPSERVYNYLFDICGETPWLGVYPRHIKPRELRERMDRHKFERCFKFAFVRNPWDWHVSQYFHHRQNPQAFFHREFSTMEFPEFIQWSVENMEESNNCQKAFLSAQNGELLVDFVGRFERLEEDFQFIVRRLGLNARLPTSNRSDHSKYREYYTPALRDEISRAFRVDIDYFGYVF